MSKTFFTAGVYVYYKDYYGVISFVCDEYITICVGKGKLPLKDVCMLVYPEDYDEIKLAKESDK
jgi:hypothetical protein